MSFSSKQYTIADWADIVNAIEAAQNAEADAAEAALGAEGAEETAEEYLDRAEELLNTESLPRNGYYAFVCEKCAPVFGHYGYFATEAELTRRAKEIHDWD